ncbi:MAG: tetratricopeptide repeat protein [bacterium]
MPEAEELFRQVASDLARHAGAGSIDEAIGLIDLCGTLCSLHRAQEGREMANKAIAILEKHPDCPFETAAALSQLASTFMAQGESKEALGVLERVIDQIENAPSEGHEHYGMTQLSSSLTSLGAAYIQARRYEDAWRVFKRTYTLKEKYFGIDSHNVILGACNLCCAASHIEDRARKTEAAEIGEHGLALLRKLGNNKDPLFASTLNNLGEIYLQLGDLDKAKQYLQEGFDLYCANLGPKHPKVSYSYMGMAELQAELKNFDLADEYCKKALEIRRSHHAGNHPDIALALELQDKIRLKRSGSMPSPVS